jgi:hypothetical protein
MSTGHIRLSRVPERAELAPGGSRVALASAKSATGPAGRQVPGGCYRDGGIAVSETNEGQSLSGDRQDDGISPLDLEGLPPVPRRIMRLILRRPDINEPDLRAAVAALPDPDRPSSAELDSVLVDMLDRRWLLKQTNTQPTTYRVNLRRKAVRTLTTDLWDALDSKGPPRRSLRRRSDETPEQ